MENTEPEGSAQRTGWLSVAGAWFDGWELQCTDGTTTRRYFVPDGAGRTVGPRLRSRAKQLYVIGSVAAFLALLIGGVMFRAERERRSQAFEAERERRSQAAAREAHLADLRVKLAETIRDVDTALNNGRRIETAPPTPSASQRLNELETRLRVFGELQPAPAEIADRVQKIIVLRETLDAVAKAGAATDAAADLAAKKDWIAADDQFALARAQWDTHPEVMVTLTRATTTGEPAALDVEAEKADIERKRRRIAQPVATARARLEVQRKKEAKERDEEAAFAAICGPKPSCGGWDGECIGLERAVKETANDPDSIDVEACSDPRLTREHCWVTTCNVRGRNAFGALILLRKTFSMSKLGIEEIR
jgi:hypothetical protein